MKSNWATALIASNVVVEGGGVLMVASAFTDSQMSNRVYVVCTNLTLNTGGQIVADACGYTKNCGPGRGVDADGMGGSSGGGYGGQGGRGTASGYAVGVPYRSRRVEW